MRPIASLLQRHLRPGTLLALSFLGGSAGAQVIVRFAEDFEAGPYPSGTVGAYMETDAAGAAAPTLWHAEGKCGAFPIGDYAVSTTSAPFTSILGQPGTIVLFTSGDNGWSGRIVTPFVFPHFGVSFQVLDVDRNGLASTFLNGGGGNDAVNRPPGSPALPNGLLAPWWDDLEHVTGTTAYAVVGASPNQRIVVEWNGLERFPNDGSGENATFQAIVHESGTIEFLYDAASFASGLDPWNATIGLETFDGAFGKDLTGLADMNATFPGAGFVLTPLPPAVPKIPAAMKTAAAAYNRGDLGFYDYDTGGANAGALEGPPLMPAATGNAVTIAFDYTKTTEGGGTGAFDQCFLETAPAGSPTWTRLAQVTGTAACTGAPSTLFAVLPDSVSSGVFRHRFRFATVDANANDYVGWYVDNVRIEEVAGGGPVLLFSEDFESGTIPGSTVGGLTEQNPATGAAADTLWHAETFCGPAGATYVVTPMTPPNPYPSLAAVPGATTLFLANGTTQCFDDDNSGFLPLPFLFDFFGVAKTQINVNVNGLLRFDSPFGSAITNDPPGTPGFEEDLIMPWWDDLELTTSMSAIRTSVSGPPGNRTFSVEWSVASTWLFTPCPANDGSSLTFRVDLSEATDAIVFRYNHAGFVAGVAPRSASVGLENATGTVGVDATGLGNMNTSFPTHPMTGMPTDLLFSPLPTPPPLLPAPLSGVAAAYNQGNLGNYHYDTGVTNRGALVSPLFGLPADTLGIEVAFDYVKQTEGGGSGSFDQCFLDARADSGASWAPALQVIGNQECASGGATVTIGSAVPPLAGFLAEGQGQVRFRFDTVNAAANGFLGWVVDNLAVTARTGSTSGPIGSACTSAAGCTPAIAAAGLPISGNPGFAIELSGADGGGSALLVVGASTASPPCALPVPFPIGSVFPGNTCTIAICPDVTLGTFPLSGVGACAGAFTLPLPLPPGLPAGTPLLLQWVVVNIATLPAPDSISVTNAIEVTIL